MAPMMSSWRSVTAPSAIDLAVSRSSSVFAFSSFIVASLALPARGGQDFCAVPE
jgi:hypothetical protein